MRLTRCAWLVGLTLLAFAPVYQVPFITWDDPYYVTHSVKANQPGLAGFLNVWSLEDVWDGRAIEFFPLRDSVYWALWQLFRPSAVPFHVASVAAHLASVLLAFALALRLRLPEPVAFWGAALFAVHPVHVENVAWVSGLKDPMFTALMLASLLSYARHRREGGARFYALSLAFLVGSLLVKSIALVTPLLMLAMDRLSDEPAPWRSALQRAAGPALICALFLVQFLLVGRAANVLVGPHGGSWAAHFFLSGWAMVRYVQQAVAPASFALQHCFRPPSGAFDWRLPVMLFAAAGAVALFAALRRRAPAAALLVAWFFACLLPVSNLVPFPAVMADRYLYASTVASCLGLAWLFQRVPGAARPALLGGAVAVLGSVTFARCLVWQSEPNLWAEVAENPVCRVDTEPATAVALLKHAGFQEDSREAVEAFQAGFSHPAFPKMYPDDRCTYLIVATRFALEARDRARARAFAEQAASTCPSRWGAWSALAAATAEVDPAASLDAARRAHRLAPGAEQQWQLGLSRLGAGDPDGVEDLAAAAQRRPEALCARFLSWMEREGRPARPSVAKAAERCRAAR